MLKFLDKTIHCINSEGKPMIVKGKPKPIFVRQISSLQLKWIERKGFQLYFIHVEELGQQPKDDPLKKL